MAVQEPPGALLIGTEWDLTSIGPGTSPLHAVEGDPPHMIFRPKDTGTGGKVNGKCVINKYSGSYAVEMKTTNTGMLSFSNVHFTPIEGPQVVGRIIEFNFFSALDKVEEFELSDADGSLRMMAKSKVLMKFKARRRFIIPKDETEMLSNVYGGNYNLQMSLMKRATHLAYPPISNFNVGATGMGKSGVLYYGVNIEFPGGTLDDSIHAEVFLIINALQNGETGLDLIAVSAGPCGYCRQFMVEVESTEDVQVGFEGETYTLSQLLPWRFGPRNLLENPNTLFDEHVHHVELADPGVVEGLEGALREAADEAVKWAKKCYCPYTNVPSGAAVTSKKFEGAAAGGYAESVAFNPSFSPFQAAIVSAFVKGMSQLSQVEHVFLAELPDAVVRHEPRVAALVRACCPKAELHVLPLVKKS